MENRLLTTIFLLLLVSLLTVRADKVALQFPLGTAPAGRRVAIIGAGAAGTSAAYYLKQTFSSIGSEVPKIDIYERTPLVGGRTRVVQFDGLQQPVELGASIFVDVNKNLHEAVRLFNLTLNSPEKDFVGGVKRRFGLWDGLKFLFQESENSYLTGLKMVYRYGLSPVKVSRIVKDTVAKFLRAYDVKEPFETISAMVEALEMGEYLSTTSEDYFVNSKGIRPNYVREFIMAASRGNYCQDVQKLHALGSLISLAASGRQSSVKGGNFQIFERFAKNSGAEMYLNTSIAKIVRTEGERRPLYSLETWDGRREVEYDAVILAAPFHISGIELVGFAPKIPETEYKRVHVTFVVGKVNPRYFGLNRRTEVPSSIISIASDSADAVNNKSPFYTFSVLASLSAATYEDAETVVKMFSDKALTEEELDEIWESRSTTIRHEWLQAFPVLKPRPEYAPIRLDDGVFYVNGFESVFSTMESETVASKNVVRLLAGSWSDVCPL